MQELEATRLWTGDAVITGRASGALWGFAGLSRGVLEIATATRKRHDGSSCTMVQVFRPRILSGIRGS